MNIDSADLKKTLLESLEVGRSKASKGANPALDMFLGELERLLVFIVKSEKEERLDMETTKRELLVQIVKLDELPARHRASELEERIKAVAERLKKGEAGKIDSDAIKYGHLSVKVSELKKANKLSKEFKVVRRGQDVYLARQ